jgi:hypothetical protein
MSSVGFEPTRPFGQRILSPLRLPVTSRGRFLVAYFALNCHSVQGGSRTHTPSLATDFESVAATNYATWTDFML